MSALPPITGHGGRIPRYDKLAQNFLAGVLIAATVVWWLN